ncbi:MAG: hypothetical protein R3C53_27190 [Pirellulaceae bacterium]
MQHSKRLKLRLALIAALCGQCVQADESSNGFIVQPKLRQSTQTSTAQPTADVTRPASSSKAEPRPAHPTIMPSAELELAPATPSQFAPGIPSNSNSYDHQAIRHTNERSNELAESSSTGDVRVPGVATVPRTSTWSPTDANQVAAQPVGFARQMPHAQTRSEPSPSLQWVSRGSAVLGSQPQFGMSPAAPQRPLEFENPQFVPAVPANVPLRTNQQTPFQTAELPGSNALSRREALAATVSKRILGSGSNTKNLATVSPLESSPGWQAVGERLTAHLQACESLLRKNAFLSARAEAEQAAIHLMQILDLATNSYTAEPEWYAALQALAELEDFSLVQSTDREGLKHIVQAHQTDVLKQTDLSQLSPLVAAQHYRQAAERSLIQASQAHPWASDVLYSMGRTYQAQADAGAGSVDNLRWKAATFYRAAMTVSPSNSLAANQLGFVYLQMDRPQEARAAIAASLATSVSQAALENLVEASRRLGDSATGQWAMENLAMQRQLNPTADAPMVVELDPRTFATISPPTVGPQGQPTPAPRIATGIDGPEIR